MSSFMPPLKTNTISSMGPIHASPVRISSNASLLTNKQASHEESLYYTCLRLMTRLSKVPGMLPYIDLAHAKAEEMAEEQAMILSSPEYIQASTKSNRNSDPTLGHWTQALFTFASGILPAQISYDPVTPISALFRQGAPLCLIFNDLNPENAIEIVSSDDIKICKMSIYKFFLAAKQHLNIRDDELFPVTMVFSDDTSHLMRIIRSVDLVLNMSSKYDCLNIKDQLCITDSRSKVVREFIETERRFVQDLETLVKYREELIEKQLVTRENINMLFPNLIEIIDFQRRFLVGLECNASVPSKYQRIGSIFVHAGVEGFKIFEAWSLFQNSAIEFINSEANRLQNSTIIKDPYELQNFFLIKPIQRLTKYPLLLSQLMKETDSSWPNYTELQQAYLISKEVAQSINESQRRSENIKLLKDLQEKVVDWKGYTTANVGDLLYFNVVTVKDLLTDGHSNEKEVHCFLFEKVIYFFKELSSKNKLLSSRKKSNLSLATALSQSANSSFQLSLNGIVYINKITRSSISDTSSYFGNQQGHFLSLKWKGNKDTGGCVMRFKSEENLHQWNNSIKKLSTETETDDMYTSHLSNGSLGSFINVANNINRNINGRSRVSSESTAYISRMRTASTSSFNNLGNVNYPPLPAEKKIRSVSVASSISTNVTTNRKSSSNTSIGNDELVSNVSNLTLSKPFNESSNTPTSSNGPQRTHIRLSYSNEKINLSVNSDIEFEDLVSILIKKMSYSMEVDESNLKKTKFNFKDEDGDYIRFQSDDDWDIAKEMLQDFYADEQILDVRAKTDNL
ncbi:Rho family guanine nucleotide exchange factor [Martiniozyma asiatica (nom. inval.)]|nr:Rho family guanine nucleotide exchange factor [Martiniozyma asiatica]